MRFLKSTSLILAASLCATSYTVAEITVKPAGLQVVWDDGGKLFGGFRVFNSKPGVSVAFLLSSDGPSFIDVDDDATLKIGGVDAECHFFGQQSDLSKDGKHLQVKFDAEGAKIEDGRLPVSGEIEVLTASEKGQVETGLLDLKKGTVVEFPAEAGLPKFTISKVGKPEWGDDAFEMTLKTRKDFQKPVSVSFVEEDGTRHEAKEGGWSRMGFGKSVTVEIGYKTKKKPGKAKIVVEYWKDLEKVKVPVKLSLGMDGPK